MSAFQLLDQLEQQGFLEPRVVKSLRRQIDSSDKRISAKSLASLLVRKGQLTASQARRSLEALSAPPAEEEEELGLADEEPPKPGPVANDIVQPVMDERNDKAPSSPPIAGLDSEDPSESSVESGLDTELSELESDLEGEDEDQLGDEFQSAEAGKTLPRRPSGLAAIWASLRRPERKKYTANQWDSPLLLVGGGGLLLLSVVGVALYFFLSRGTGDDAFNAANESYRQQAYSQAASQFQQFVEDFPNHPKTSMAKVKIGMTRIWRSVERRQWKEALEAVCTELPQIVGEEAFDDGARPELASLLPEIMDGFAEQALNAEDVPTAETYLELAQQSLEEVNNSAYLPSSLRRGQQPRIEQILAKLETVKRRINRDRELVEVVQRIGQMVEAGKIAEAYQARRALLKTYPSVEVDERLQAATRRVAEREQQLVAPIDDNQLPLPEQQAEAQAGLFQVVLADQRGEAVDRLSQQVVTFATHGAVFGLKASDGTLLWRYPLGFESTQTPVSLEPLGSPDVLVVRQATNELTRLDAATGRVVWRLQCPGPVNSPQIGGGRLYVSGRVTHAAASEPQDSIVKQGYLLRIDADSGSVTHGVTMPVAAASGPAIDVDRQRLIVPAAHSTVYVFHLDDCRCLGVSHLGHRRDTIVIPPALLAGVVLIAENPGVDFSLLHALEYASDEAVQLQRLNDPKRLEGQAVVPLIVAERRVVLATDRGRISVLQLDLNQPDSPLRVTAEAVNTVPDGTASYALLSAGRLWIADNQLTRYEVQSSRGQLVRKWINQKGDRFIGPLKLIDDVLFHIRQPAGRAGATISAIAAVRGERDEGETIWQVELAVPPAGQPFVDRQADRITVVTRNAAVFALDPSAIRAGLSQTPQQAAPRGSLTPLVDSVRVGSHTRVFLHPAGSRSVMTYRSDRSMPLQNVALDLGTDQSIAALPVVFEQGLLVAASSGAVNVFDPATGKPLLDPFQPVMDPTTRAQWMRPAVSADSETAVLADRTGLLYQIAAVDEPKPRLVEVSQQPSPAPLIADPVVVQQTVFGVVRGEGNDLLHSFVLPDLDKQAPLPLPGTVRWGPFAVGKLGLLMTESKTLVGFDATGVRFQIEEGLDGMLAGPPVSYQDGFVVATVAGGVLQFDATGRLRANVALSETLGSGPVPFAEDRFIVCGGDGTLHIVSLK